MTESSSGRSDVVLDDRLVGNPVKELEGSNEVTYSQVAQIIMETVAELEAAGAIKADQDALKYIEERTLVWARERFFPNPDPSQIQELRGSMTAVGLLEISGKVMEIAAFHGWDNAEIEGPTQSDAIEAYDAFVKLQPTHNYGSVFQVSSDEYLQARQAFEDIMKALPDDDRREVWKIINQRYGTKGGE